MRKTRASYKNRPLRAASQVFQIKQSKQKEDSDEKQLPAIEIKKPKPQSVIRSSKKSLDYNKLSQKINLNIKVNETRKDEISEIDLSFKTNKLELKLHLQSQTKPFTPYKQRPPQQTDLSALQGLERASTPPRKSRSFKADEKDLNMRSESFATLQPNVIELDTVQSNIRDFMNLHQRLQQLVQSMKKNTTIELVTSINAYLEQTEHVGFKQIEQMFSNHSKAIRQAILNFRLGLVVIVNSFFDVHFYLSNISNFKNILVYNMQNYFHICELLVEALKADYQQLAQELSLMISQHKRVQPNKKMDTWTLIRQNSELIMNLFKQLTKQNRDLYQYIINFFRNITPLCSVHDSVRALQEYISFYFTVQQSYHGLLGIPLISVAPQPYLPQINPKQYTLVLDMDETLIHFTDQTGHFLIRPHAQSFLQEMNNYYELVVFTAGLPDYANWVLDQVDKHNFIQFRLFRQHALQYQTQFIKDLSRLGRDLAKTIIVDNVADNFQNQPDNGIFIKAWYSDEKDTALAELGPILRQIVVNKSEDVRLALKQVRSQLPLSVQLPQI